MPGTVPAAGSQPKLGATADELVLFYDGDRTWILTATVIFCFAFLELLWFAVALSSVLRDACSRCSCSARTAWSPGKTPAGSSRARRERQSRLRDAVGWDQRADVAGDRAWLRCA
jgi:hypothetical protein